MHPTWLDAEDVQVVHDRWQRAAAWAGAAAGLALAGGLVLLAPGPDAGPEVPPRATAVPSVADWCAAANEGFAAAVDEVVRDPGGLRADAADRRRDAWAALQAEGAGEAAWRSAGSVPARADRAEAVRQLQVLRDALAEASASGRAGAVRAEAQALDQLVRRWC